MKSSLLVPIDESQFLFSIFHCKPNICVPAPSPPPFILQLLETPALSLVMIFSLEDFDTLPLSTNIQKNPPISPTDSPENQPNPSSNIGATGESTGQQDTSLPTLALDPVLLALSPPIPNPAVNPILHGEDLTQFARHLALQKGLSKHSADELVVFAKVLARPISLFIFLRQIQRPFGEQLIWLAASQLSLNDAVLSIYCGEVSPTLIVSSLSILSTQLVDMTSETH